MKDYSKISDEEINKDVGEIVSRDKLSITASNGKTLIHRFSDCGDFKGICLGWMEFDPCNNPADAWPIIINGHIAVVPYRHALPQAWPTSYGVASKFCTEDANPLRAAMIVFLMMNDKEVEK